MVSENIAAYTKMQDIDENEVERFYLEKYAYIADLVKGFPWNKANPEEVDVPILKDPDIKLPARLYPSVKNGSNQAKSIEELQAKLALLKNKSKLPYKEKLLKKNLKNRIKKEGKSEQRKLTKKLSKQKRNNGEVQTVTPTIKKPVYNSEGKMIFSRFDFSDIGTKNSDIKKTVKDPKIALKKIKEQEEKLKTLKEAGEVEKVQKIVENKAWKTAIMKSEGVKVKDDPELLKQSIKKSKDKKKKSAEKWKDRQEKVKATQEAKQKKRLDNIEARAKKKKLGKLKKLVKRGKIIPGF